MNILITGATGMIGQHLVHYLALTKEHTIISAVRDLDKFSHLNLPGKTIKWDINNNDPLYLDPELKIDVVVHLAGVLFSHRPQDYYHINLQAMKQLIAGLKAHLREQPERKLKFIHISSIAAAGPSPAPSSCRLVADSPLGHYGKSKLQSELLLKELAPHAWDRIIIRPPMVIGPRDKAMLPLFKMIKRGPIIYPGLNWKRKEYSFICVYDLVDFLKRVIESSSTSDSASLAKQIPTYYPAYPQAMKYHELIKNIQKHISTTVAIPIVVPIASIKLAARLLEYAHRLRKKIAAISGNSAKIEMTALTQDKVRELAATRWVYSSEDTIRDYSMNYRWDLDNTIKETINSYRKNCWL